MPCMAVVYACAPLFNCHLERGKKRSREKSCVCNALIDIISVGLFSLSTLVSLCSIIVVYEMMGGNSKLRRNFFLLLIIPPFKFLFDNHWMCISPPLKSYFKKCCSVMWELQQPGATDVRDWKKSIWRTHRVIYLYKKIKSSGHWIVRNSEI